VPPRLAAGSVWWGKITLQSRLPQDGEWVLHLANRSLNYAQVYQEDREAPGNFFVSESGLYTPWNQQLTRAEAHYAKVRIFLRPQQRLTLYIKLHNVDKRKPMFQLHLQSMVNWQQNMQERNLQQGIFQGVVWMSVIYNLFIFILLRDRASLFYGLHIFCQATYVAAYHGLLFEWLPVSGQAYPYLYVLATGMSNMADILFKRHFLNTRKLLPRWDRLMTWGLVFMATEMLVMLSWQLFTNDSASVYQVHSVANVFSSVFIVVLLWPLFGLKRQLAYFVLVGTLLLHGTILYNLFSYYLAGVSQIKVQQVMLLLEALCYFIGISFRIRDNERDKRQAQDELIKQLRANETVSRELDSFLYRASHDMHRPLTSIMGLHGVAQLSAKQAEGNPEQLHIMDLVNNVAKGMDRMVQKYIMLHQVHDATIATSEVDLAQLINKLKAELSELSQQLPHWQWIVDVDNLKVDAPPVLLEVVLRNLMENCLFFSRHQPDSYGKISAVRAGNQVTIKVMDNGIGVAEAYYEQIFGMYFRGSETATHGNGLGLYIVKKAVDKMGANISVSSRVPVLTEFRLTILDKSTARVAQLAAETVD
jgi:signal transduction histidine kinase